MKKRYTLKRPVTALAKMQFTEFEMLIAGIYRETDALIEGMSTDAICKKGCAQCCNIPVHTTRIEAAYIAKFMMRRYSVKERLAVGRHLEALRERYKREISDSFTVIPTTRSAPPVSNDLPELSLVYQVKPFPMRCPFLINNLCSIHPVRPFICRTYLSENFVDCREAQITPIMQTERYSLPVSMLKQRLYDATIDFEAECSRLSGTPRVSIEETPFFRFIATTERGEMAILTSTGSSKLAWLQIS